MSKKRDEEPQIEPAVEPVVEAPLQEYPKMLYVGPYRQQLTVNTAEEEARWVDALKADPGAKTQFKKGDR